MKLEELILEYGNFKQIGKLQLNSQGVCHLLINDSSIVSLEKSIDKVGFYLYSIIGELHQEKEKIALMALEGNLFKKETGNACIGYDPRTNSLILFQYFIEEMTNFHDFKENLAEFMRYLSYWLMKYEKAHDSNPPPEEQQQHEPLPIGSKKIFFA